MASRPSPPKPYERGRLTASSPSGPSSSTAMTPVSAGSSSRPLTTSMTGGYGRPPMREEFARARSSYDDRPMSSGYGPSSYSSSSYGSSYSSSSMGPRPPPRPFESRYGSGYGSSYGSGYGGGYGSSYGGGYGSGACSPHQETFWRPLIFPQTTRADTDPVCTAPDMAACMVVACMAEAACSIPTPVIPSI